MKITASLTLAIAALATVSSAAQARPWQPVPRASLTVTDGSVSTFRTTSLRTQSGAMRAVVNDGGVHATRARLAFRLAGPSTETIPLGSGIVRTQIGLKLRASDPCNLVYVMWRSAPESAIAVYVKRNAGQTTSSQCANNGYTDVATIPLSAAQASGRHVLEARTRRAGDGSLVLSILTDGAKLRKLRLSPALTAGLDGPAGVRSDNGDYVFGLWT
jgi:hypothetical protein